MTIDKKKGVDFACCYSMVSPNTRTNTTVKPTPYGARIHILLLISTFEFGDFRSTSSKSKHYLFLCLVKRLYHNISFIKMNLIMYVSLLPIPQGLSALKDDANILFIS